MDLKLLAVVSESSFATDDLERTAPIDSDTLGPFIVGAVVRATGPIGESTSSAPSQTPGTVAVFGDSDFTTNELLDQTSNIDLLQNTLAWLVDEGDQISIRPNASAKNTLTLSDLDALIMWLLSAFVLPCLALGGAIATYMSRRKR